MDRMIELAKMILSTAKAQGASYAHCYVSESEKREFNADGGRLTLMRTLFDRNVSITVLKDQRKGSVRINRFDEDAIRAAVADCIAASESAEPDSAWQFAEGPLDECFTEGSPKCDTEALFSRTQELMRDVSARHPKILMEQLITEHNLSRGVYMNSQDVTYRSEEGCYQFSLMYSAHEGEKATSFYYSDVTLAHLDKPIIDCALVERDLTDVENQLDAQPLQGKFVGPAILTPNALGEIVLGTVMGNFMSDSVLIDGTSIWKDKLGQQVADERFSLSILPQSDDLVIGQHFTSEGYPAQPCHLISGGRLTSFALSQYGANKTGGVRAGTDGGCITIPAGDQSLEEIIRGIDRGILVMRFSGGEPAASGEFSGVAKNSFLIEHGKIACALTETMISGCVPDMLRAIRAISSDKLLNGSSSLPYIAFDGVTISGK